MRKEPGNEEKDEAQSEVGCRWTNIAREGKLARGHTGEAGQEEEN